MRSGAEYRESLRDGRRVWVMGEGPIDDVTTHPATAPMVDAYADWYDRHFESGWRDTLLNDPDVQGDRRPLAFDVPQSAHDLRRLGNSIYSVGFVSAGNVTHTPGYGALIALGIADAVKTLGEPAGRVATALAYRERLARTGRFLTLSGGGAVIGDRFRGPEEQAGVRLVKEADGGIIVSGMAGMHTAVPFAEDVYVGANRPNIDERAMFAVAVNAPGVRIVARKPSARASDRFRSPLSSRYDELDAQLWLDNVFVPWENVFALRYPLPDSAENRRRDRVVAWLEWHHQNVWLARADFTLGLALAVTDAVELRGVQGVVDQLVDLVIDAQTIRSCLTAAELDPELSPGGFLLPKPLHLAPAIIYTLRARQRMAEILRNIPGSSLVIAPTERDLADPAIASDLETAFGGGGYTARQRSALMQLAWDHVSSGLDGREASFEHHASGGLPGWRARIQRWFGGYDELANRVLRTLDVEMPELRFDELRDAAPPARRPISPSQTPPAAHGETSGSPDAR